MGVPWDNCALNYIILNNKETHVKWLASKGYLRITRAQEKA